MYDHFVGEVCEAQGTRVVLRVAGIGYEFKTPVRVATGLKPGETATLRTILHVVDGSPSLLGFSSVEERELARRVLTVSGVGPSIALALLSTYTPAEIARLIVGGDAKGLQRVKGVGGKTAERLCLELRDRVAQLGLTTGTPDSGSEDPIATSSSSTILEDAVAALVTLGFQEADARKRADKALSGGAVNTEDLIKAVLRG